MYFPSCLSRVMGRPPLRGAKGIDGLRGAHGAGGAGVTGHAQDASGGGGASDAGGDGAPLIDTLLTLTQRAGVPVWIPPRCAGNCCGMPFASKGYTAASREMLERTVDRFWDWSDGGRIPVVVDASSCAHALRTSGDALPPDARQRWERLRILDAIEFVHDVLMPRLPVRQLPWSVTLHPACSARKLGLETKLLAIARCCARSASVPQTLECCGTAGDRGLLFPELTASALAPEVEEVIAGEFDGYYSCNVTCEMGLRAATGKPYESFLHLVEEATRAGAEASDYRHPPES